MRGSYSGIKRRLDGLRRDLTELSSGFIATTGSNAWNHEVSVVDTGKDLLLSPNEVNSHHGTGILLGRIFNPDTSVNIRSRDQYPEKGPFKSLWIDARGQSRPAVFSLVLRALAKENIRRILCVPYFSEDYLIGIAAKSLLGVPLAVWVMDDCTAHHSLASRKAIRELFDLADIRFVISPEMRDAYETKFQRKFYVLPPTVNAALILHPHRSDASQNLAAKTCAMIGNVWSQAWLEELLRMVKKSGWTLHWYGHGSASGCLKTSSGELRAHGIIEKGFLPEKELLKILPDYPFVVVPTGSENQEDACRGLMLLSLPTRMPFLLAAIRIPILVIGSEKSCSAKFVRRFGVGLSISYEEQQFSAAVKKLSDEIFIAQCCKNAAANAETFSDAGLAEWIWESCNHRVAIDERFERPFRRQLGDLIPYVEEAAPQDLYGDFKVVYLSLRRIARRGYQPDFVIDVGASTGVWSATVQRVFPSARFILVEPLPDRYPQQLHKKHPQFEWVAAAASNENGKTAFQISNDLFGSSLLHPEDAREYQSVEIAVTTLDALLRKKKIQGRGILKIDVQFAEHLVIEGATTLLKQIDFLIMELTLQSCALGAKTFVEMVNQMRSLGFRYFDDLGEWRCPMHGTLEQKDVLFVNQDADLRWNR